MASAGEYYELYRESRIGLCLTDQLDDLINEERIEPQLAIKVLSTFDHIMSETLASMVRAKLHFKASLSTYRNCDDIWTFVLKDVTFTLDDQSTFTSDRVKVVSCNSKRPGEP